MLARSIVLNAYSTLLLCTYYWAWWLTWDPVISLFWQAARRQLTNGTVNDNPVDPLDTVRAEHKCRRR
ncbi:hypothetical protein BD309DRAFT_954571 [Dichomitus squalens]|nr:hypothetical protein BD309DRAFT_954571 [Dichomitus squalens]